MPVIDEKMELRDQSKSFKDKRPAKREDVMGDELQAQLSKTEKELHDILQSPATPDKKAPEKVAKKPERPSSHARKKPGVRSHMAAAVASNKKVITELGKKDEEQDKEHQEYDEKFQE